MPVGHTTWTVLDNGPIEKLEDNLWYVSGKMRGGNERKMLIARRDDGDLVIFNAIALDDAGMKDLEAFGRPRYLVVPNAFHRMDAFIWKQRYPELKVVAPRGSTDAVAKAVAVDLACDGLPADARVSVMHPRGVEREAMMVVRHGKGMSVVMCDSLLNMKASQVKFPFSLAMAPLGTLSVPRFARWMFVKDRPAFKSHLDELAAEVTRVFPGHGTVVDSGAGDALRAAAARLA